jgi:SDR family mycofactocin-dependent oxidoreductase
MTRPARPWAIVTGAARGMGAAVAERLANDGFDLLLVDAPAADLVEAVGYPLGSAEQLADVAERCRACGGQALAVPGDVRSEAALAAAVELIPADRLQVAVAVAGIIGADKPAWEFTHAELAVDLAVNFHGVANLARAVVPRLLTAPSGFGRFVAVVSTAGEAGLPRLAGYVSAKHAALGFIRTLAADLGPFGVTANAVLPGSTRTALLERSARVYGLAGAADFAPHQRLGRLVEPVEIAAAVGWLCGPGATAVTGAAIRVDGGFVG